MRVRTRTSSLGESLSARRGRQWPTAGASDFRLGKLWRSRLALLVCVLALDTPASPADTKPELEFQPSTVILPFGGVQQATALVVVHNPTDATLRDLRLSWLQRPSLDVQPTAPLSLPVLAPHADHVWTLDIKPAHALATRGAAGPTATVRPGGPAAGSTVRTGPLGVQETCVDDNLDLRLDYTTVAGSKSSPQVILRSLPVKTQDLGDLDKVLDVQIKTTLEALESSQSGSIYLVLKNNSARTINITNITPIGKGVVFCQGGKTKLSDDRVPFCFSSSFHPATLTPYQTAIEESQVSANERLKAGKYLLVFQIATQSYENGVPLGRSIVVSQAVDVGVLGESAIPKVADLLSFFLLPGALFLLTMATLWQTMWLQVPPFPGEFPLKWKEPSFWLVSLTISLLVVILPWRIAGRWYFKRYGLEEVALLWFGSILAGVAAYVGWQFARNQSMPSERDSPLDALRKLELRKEGPLRIKALRRFQLSKEGLLRKRVKLKDRINPAFVLAGSLGDAVVWVCPPARVEFNRTESATEQKIRDEIGKKGEIHALFVLLQDPNVTTRWLKEPVGRVCAVTKEQIEGWVEEDIFIQLE